MKSPCLFVYGTLAPGRPNAHVLAGLEGSWQAATITGTLYPEGWGATLGFPAVIPSGRGQIVDGYVFISSELPDHWSRLDAFEGPGYERVKTSACLSDGSVVPAYVYALRESP